MKDVCKFCGEYHSGPFPLLINGNHFCYDAKYKLEPLIEGKQRFNKKQHVDSLEDSDKGMKMSDPRRYLTNKELEAI